MCACLGAGTDFACVWEGAQGRAPGRVGVDGCKAMEGRGGGLGCLPSRMAVLIKIRRVVLSHDADQVAMGARLLVWKRSYAAPAAYQTSATPWRSPCSSRLRPCFAS